jgi:hypothetical protein
MRRIVNGPEEASEPPLAYRHSTFSVEGKKPGAEETVGFVGATSA